MPAMVHVLRPRLPVSLKRACARNVVTLTPVPSVNSVTQKRGPVPKTNPVNVGLTWTANSAAVDPFAYRAIVWRAWTIRIAPHAPPAIRRRSAAMHLLVEV